VPRPSTAHRPLLLLHLVLHLAMHLSLHLWWLLRVVCGRVAHLLVDVLVVWSVLLLDMLGIPARKGEGGTVNNDG
jgi:hypothetical protein